jgi:hypothetical protein
MLQWTELTHLWHSGEGINRFYKNVCLGDFAGSWFVDHGEDYQKMTVLWKRVFTVTAFSKRVFTETTFSKRVFTETAFSKRVFTKPCFLVENRVFEFKTTFSISEPRFLLYFLTFFGESFNGWKCLNEKNEVRLRQPWRFLSRVLLLRIELFKTRVQTNLYALSNTKSLDNNFVLSRNFAFLVNIPTMECSSKNHNNH